ncbi:type II toxin-antitoxin system tRNA(fMet)-specific endonuclease VapC [Rufibacter quisquiliarum]|uniref:type II toxin-antitoxin system tRNA(fMet)-specific endonuclease VapC n=1 Tax=Rufibacter quisquiliarum TaxID=1549639 RepID=UPI0024847087|nr:type II toxin-antitoxin system VapC family toxin [Rufibacter quisquiliarum]
MDTNICIYIIKKRPEIVLERFKELSLGSVGISAITLAELEFGIRKSSNPDRNLEALNQFLVPLDIKDFHYNATVEYGKIRANLEKAGTPIGPLDTLIAAHALSLNATLVTNNEKEFNRVTGLKIENWAK